MGGASSGRLEMWVGRRVDVFEMWVGRRVDVFEMWVGRRVDVLRCGWGVEWTS